MGELPAKCAAAAWLVQRRLARGDLGTARWFCGLAAAVVFGSLGAAEAQTVSNGSITLAESQASSTYAVGTLFNAGGSGCTVVTPGPSVAVTPLSAPPSTGGVLSAGAVGTNLTYTSNQGLYFNAAGAPDTYTLTFDYQCPGGGAGTASGTLSTIVPQFAPGTISVTVAENSGARTISAGLLAPNRNYTGITFPTAPGKGSVTAGAGANPSILYTPAANTTGTDTFSFVLRQGSYQSAVGTISVQINAVVPTAALLSLPATENTAASIDVSSANTTGRPYTVSLPAAATARGGTVSVAAGSSVVTYTPAANFSGGDSFTYRLTNSAGSATGAVNVTVAAASPTAAAYTGTTSENTAFTLDLASSNSGCAGCAYSVPATSAQGGSVRLPAGSSVVTYTPRQNFTGTDSFAYTLTQSSTGQTATANVTVTVTAAGITAASYAKTTSENTAFTLDLASSNTGCAGCAYSVPATSAQGGSVKLPAGSSVVTYTPRQNFTGTDSFAYTLTQSSTGQTATANVSIQVTAVPMPRAIDITLNSDQPVSIDIVSGASGGPFTAAAITRAPPPSDGTARLAGMIGPIVFTPAAGFDGTATILYTLSNASGVSAPAVITVTVSGRPNPIADPAVIALLNAQLLTAQRFYEQQLKNFEQRLEDIHRGAHGFSRAGLTLGSGAQQPTGNGAPPGDPLGSGTPPAPSGGGASADSEATIPSAADLPIELPDRLGVFVNGVVNFGQRNGTAYQDGFGFNTDGVSVGVDYRLKSWAVLGIGGGFSGGRDDIDHNGSHTDADSYNVTLYGTIDASDKIYIDGILTYGSLHYDSRRFAPLNGLFANGKRGGDQLYGAITGGYDLDFGPLSVDPYVRFNGATATLDHFRETGAGIASLSYGQQKLTDIATTLGIRGDYAYSMEDGILSPHFRLEYNHEFAGTDHTNLLYADQVGGAGFRFTGDPVDRNNFTIGLGANYLTEDALSFFVDYEALLAYRGEESQTVTFGISKRF